MKPEQKTIKKLHNITSEQRLVRKYYTINIDNFCISLFDNKYLEDGSSRLVIEDCSS